MRLGVHEEDPLRGFPEQSAQQPEHRAQEDRFEQEDLALDVRGLRRNVEATVGATAVDPAA